MHELTANSEDTSLQDRFDANGICFGCGPANSLGLQIKSYVRGDKVVASFLPSDHHQGFQGMINGGIIGAIFDCHMNWTAAWHLMKASGSATPPCTVTGRFEVRFAAPTPTEQPLHFESEIVDLGERKAEVAAKLECSGQVTATGHGVFVAVQEGHPAFKQWS